MKKSIKVIGIIATMGVMLVCTYLLGTTQAETITEIQTVRETIGVIPDGYIALNKCIPLADIACYFIDNDGYPCFELKDVATQYNADNTRSYSDIMESLADETEDFQEHYIDMRKVVSYKATDYGLQLYCEDGSGYYIER